MTGSREAWGLLRYLSLPRLASGLLVVAALLALYAFIRDEEEGDVFAGALLETPLVAGRELAVGVKEGHLAPDFLLSSPAGDLYRLSDFRGRAVMINFWASWCGSCLAEMPEIKALQAEIGGEALVVVAVNAGETRQRALEYINFLEAPFAWVLDPRLVVSDAYGVYGLPLSVFVDAEGIVRGVYRGHMGRPIMEQYTRAALDAAPVGETPLVFRLITPIPRERMLLVSRRGKESIEIESRTLRCDVSYCAEPAIAKLRALDGVREVELTAVRGEPVLRIRFDARVVDEARVLEALTVALEAHADPVYVGPLELRFRGG